MKSGPQWGPLFLSVLSVLSAFIHAPLAVIRSHDWLSLALVVR
ncbi:hypothetical protein SAMN05660971_02396 [Halomonas cupida]|uniref:Uncharacterized protein n=1 Tax=Halomonas cupida TaxID=44933 RepID=A0A1M7GLI2_9GAMM|nr:hypothetical protein SAMN05660971_02396 [Halomonas cupida]